jgi:tetratricopeptide (TPR) repeat protein
MNHPLPLAVCAWCAAFTIHANPTVETDDPFAALVATIAPATAPAPAQPFPAASSTETFGAGPVVPPTAESLLTMAARFAERGDHASADLAFTEALQVKAPAEFHGRVLLEFAAHLRSTGRATRAASIYESFLTRYPTDARLPQALIELGRTLRQLGAWELALARFYAVLNSALNVDPETVAEYRRFAQIAKFEIAETHYQRGDFDTAGRFFSRVRLLDLPPEDRARAAFREAYSRYHSGPDDAAIAGLRRFLAEFPQHPSALEARYLLCTALRRNGQHEAALAETLHLLRSARDATASDADAWAYWQRRTGNQLANEFYAQGDFGAALTIYETLATLRSDPAWRWPALYQIGLCYERLRQAGRARDAYLAILQEADGPEKPPAPIGPDLVGMARWRLSQLGWQDELERSLNALGPHATTE